MTGSPSTAVERLRGESRLVRRAPGVIVSGQEAVEVVELPVPLYLPSAATLAQWRHAAVEVLEDVALHRPLGMGAGEVVAQGTPVPTGSAAQSALVVVEEGAVCLACHRASITTISFLDRWAHDFIPGSGQKLERPPCGGLSRTFQPSRMG